MSEYYDKEKFSGGEPSRRPPQKNDDWDWLKWPIIIALFGLGLWPLGIVAIAYFSNRKKQRRAEAARWRNREARERAERTMREAEERIARAKERLAQAENARPTAAAEAAEKQRAPETAARQERSAAAQPEERRAPEKQQQKQPEKTQTPKKEKEGRLLRILGICMVVLGAIMGMSAAVDWLQYHYAAMDVLSVGLGFLAGGGIVFGKGQQLAKLSQRTKKYLFAIGGADRMSLDTIAKRVNRKPKQVAKELQNLIDKGYLGDDAYIDYEKGCFARFGAAPEETEESDPAEEMPREAEEGYSGILRDLRTANDRIPDARLSAQIERLEQISALIFKEVEEHPEKRSRIHTFFDYYLPTTQKLLDTYAEFDEMGVEGENVTQAKERIRQMMDSIVEGFEYQLDQLYSADAMEVASDIKVMETMLNRDTASAARDFGYSAAKKPNLDAEIKPQQLEM